MKIKTIVVGIFLLMNVMFSLSFADDNVPDEQTASEATIKDPFMSFNRVMLDFNERVDITILRPIATLYNIIIPKPLNQGINNFFNNLHNLTNIPNDLLQLHFGQAFNDAWRLLINTTIGVGGLFDVAARMDLPLYSNDFGLTLARWGLKEAPYIVWPFWGPSTLRDGIGNITDYYLFSIYPHVYPTRARYALYGLSVVDRRAQILQLQPLFDEAIYDKYFFMRHVYLQGRAAQIEKNLRLGYYGRSTVPVEPYELKAEVVERATAVELSTGHSPAN